MKPLKDKKSIVREILEACYEHGWLQAGINEAKSCGTYTIEDCTDKHTVSNFTPSLTGNSRKYFCYLKKNKKKPCMGSFKCFTDANNIYNSTISDFADAAAAICPEEFSGVGFGRQFYGAMSEGSGFEEQFKNYMELMNWCRNYRNELVAQGLLCPDDEQYFFRALQWIFNAKFPYSGHNVSYKNTIFKCADASAYVSVAKNNFGTYKPNPSFFLLLDFNWYPMALYWLSCEKDKNSKKRTYLTFDSRDYAIAINVFHQISLYILENFDVSKMAEKDRVTLQTCDFSTIHERIKDFSQEARLSPADYAESILFPTWCNDNNLAYYPILEQDSFKPLALKGKENEYKRPDFMIYCNDGTQNKAIFVDVKTVLVKECKNNEQANPSCYYLNNVEHNSYSIYDPIYFACYKNEKQGEVSKITDDGPKLFADEYSVKEYQQQLLDKKCPDFLMPRFVELGNCCAETGTGDNKECICYKEPTAQKNNKQKAFYVSFTEFIVPSVFKCEEFQAKECCKGDTDIPQDSAVEAN